MCLSNTAHYMAIIVQAESPDEIKEAIEAFALPPGSSRIKRESSFNVSVNAYTGLYAGWERIKGFDPKFAFNSFGLTAPISVAISKGTNRFLFLGEGRHTVVFNICLPDEHLGAVAAYRFSTDADGDTLSAETGSHHLV